MFKQGKTHSVKNISSVKSSTSSLFMRSCNSIRFEDQASSHSIKNTRIPFNFSVITPSSHLNCYVAS